MRYTILFGAMMAMLCFSPGTAAAQEQQQQQPAQEGAQASGTEDGVAAKSDSGGNAERQQQRRRRTTNQAELELQGKKLSVSYGILPADGPDYPQLASIKEGEVVQLTRSIVTKLKTELSLKFGESVVKTANVAENYPGVYGLWLKRTEDGWSLVFNEYADVWGTQYLPDGNVAEVPLTYAALDEGVDTLTIELKEEGGGGSFQIAWGDHSWSVPFTVTE